MSANQNYSHAYTYLRMFRYLLVTLAYCQLIFYFQVTLACWGGKKKTNTRFSGNLSDPKQWITKWEPSKTHSINDYKKWMEEYKKREKQKARADAAAKKKAGKNPYQSGFEEEAGWPSHWKDMGPGHGGAAPPPWAIEAESHGKADLCFLEPDVGYCSGVSSFSVRWGFNSFVRACEQFIYSGCGGNMNNFLTEGRCNESCSKLPTGTNCFGDVMMDFAKMIRDPVKYE